MSKRLAFIYPDLRKDCLDGLEYFDKIEVFYFFRSLIYTFGEEFLNTKTRLIYWKNSLELIKYLLKHRPNFVYSAEPYRFPKAFKETIISLLYTIVFHKKLYFMQSINVDERELFGKKTPILKLYLKFYLFFCDKIFFENYKAKKQLLKVGIPKKKILYLSWFVDSQIFRPNPKYQRIIAPIKSCLLEMCLKEKEFRGC